MKMKFIVAILFSVSNFVAAQFNGVSISGINSDGTCATQSEITEQIKKLQPYAKVIRIYSLIHCKQGEYVLEAIKGTDIKLYLGLWVDASDSIFDQEKQELSRLAKKYTMFGNVLGIVVGSDSMKRENQTVKQVIKRVQQVKELLLLGSLSSIPVTTGEPINHYTEELVQSLDFIFPSIMPFMQGIPVDKASVYFFLSLIELKNRFNNILIVVGETGWPTKGSSIQGAVPSLENSLEYMKEVTSMARLHNVNVIWLEGIDQSWKISELRADFEGHWGILESNSKVPKYSSLDLLKTKQFKSYHFSKKSYYGIPTVQDVLSVALENPGVYSGDIYKIIISSQNQNNMYTGCIDCVSGTNHNSPKPTTGGQAQYSTEIKTTTKVPTKINPTKKVPKTTEIKTTTKVPTTTDIKTTTKSANIYYTTTDINPTTNVPKTTEIKTITKVPTTKATDIKTATTTDIKTITTTDIKNTTATTTDIKTIITTDIKNTTATTTDIKTITKVPTTTDIKTITSRLITTTEATTITGLTTTFYTTTTNEVLNPYYIITSISTPLDPTTTTEVFYPYYIITSISTPLDPTITLDSNIETAPLNPYHIAESVNTRIAYPVNNFYIISSSDAEPTSLEYTTLDLNLEHIISDHDIPNVPIIDYQEINTGNIQNAFGLAINNMLDGVDEYPSIDFAAAENNQIDWENFYIGNSFE
ncbi:hypothetical protein BB561_001562 [Smittium simulii]|uniref:glucan endo-1,3-beta-D-glucosidase n=1 Tax=Smittium simulii TaxID=133385 RepID=A0A2T9YU66_9FUNG|nr:hypothetical protein BB561_001562 [Smittium simulii]